VSSDLRRHLGTQGVALLIAGGLGGAPRLADASVVPNLIRVSPSVGGQGTEFLFQYSSRGADVGPDPGGDTLTMVGPVGTGCRHEVIDENEQYPFAGGPTTLEIGPGAHRFRPAYYADDYHALSIALRRRAWCPGRYAVTIVYGFSNPSSIPQGLPTSSFYGTVSFVVRRTRP
jgi:hypothetical protein